MTPAGWLRNHVGDGTVTILIGGCASFVRLAELADLAAGRLRWGATIRDVCGEYRGLLRASLHGDRYWVDTGANLTFAWACDLDALLCGEMITAELQPVIGMMAEETTTAPAAGNAGPLHA